MQSYTFNENSKTEMAIYTLVTKENKSDRNVYFFQNVTLSDLGILPRKYSVSMNPRGFKTFLLSRFESEDYCSRLLNLAVDAYVDVSKEEIDLLKIYVDKNKVKKIKPTLTNAKTLEVNGEQHYSDGDEKRLAIQLLRDWAKHEELKKYSCAPEQIRISDFDANSKIRYFIEH